MKIRNYILIVLAFVLVSCSRIAIYSAYSDARNNNYLGGVETVSERLLSDPDNVSLISAYQDIYTTGLKYYNLRHKEEEIYLLEDNFLHTPLIIRKKLSNIKVNERNHVHKGQILANRIYQRAQNIPMNKYNLKIQKYRTYERVLKFDPSRENVYKKLDYLRNKIEKTYNVKANGRYYYTTKLSREIAKKLGNEYFEKVDGRADMTLNIKLSNYVYIRPKVTEETKTHTKTREIDGKRFDTSYLEVIYTKQSLASFDLNYKLISNITGEIIINKNLPIEKEYKKSWRKYYLSRKNDYIKLPEDEKEKYLPKEEEIMKSIIKEAVKDINESLSELDRL